MLNVRFIVKMLGVIFILETFFMLAATVVAFLYKGDDFYPLLISSGIMFGVGCVCYLSCFNANEHSVGKQEGMLIVSLTWIFLSFFGMFPFYLGGYIDNVTDAYFETMSGFTTTGSTILRDIESLPKGILFWRSITQWEGGIGIVVFTMALLPIFGTNAVVMFDEETSGLTHERFRPRVTQVAKRLSGVYLFFTFCAVGLFWLGPMDLYDAVNHAMTSISTGGYSTKNLSIGFWDSAYIEYVAIMFMFIGSVNMSLIYFCFNGHLGKLLKDEEFHWFCGMVLVATLVVSVWLLTKGIITDVEEAVRAAAFHVVSLISTCGFVTEDYILWGSFFWMIALMLMFICGCAGSTSGGLKMGRFVLLVKNLSNEFQKQTHPHAVIPVRMNKHVISGDVVHRVLAFIFAYIALIVVSCFVLTIDGMDFTESIGAAISAISNVGPGLGAQGGLGNYADVPVVSKWFLSFLMMTGRLEIFTVLTILVPGFWKQ